MAKGYGKRSAGRHSYSGGLYLEVSPKGHSVWKARIREDGKDRLVKLGDASAMHNQHWARAKLEEFKEGVTEQAVASESTGAQLRHWCDRQLGDGHWTDAHYKRTSGRIERSLQPFIHVPLAELNRPPVVTHLATLDSRETAGKVYGWLRSCCEDAVDSGLLRANVFGRTPKALLVPKHQRQRRPSYGADYAAIGDLYKAIRLSDASRSQRLASQLLLLLGLRINELLPLRIDHVHNDTLVIPREMMKVKSAWRDDYIVPLAPKASELIAEAVDFSVNRYLFPGPQTGRPLRDASVDKLFRNLSNRLHTPHGTRQSLFTFALEEQGVRMPVAQSLIDHATSAGSDEHYDRAQYVDERRSVLTAWGEKISK